jgi:Protein of unknown function (DUF732)
MRMAGCSTAVTLTLAAMLSGCSAPDSMMSSVALPASGTTSDVPGTPGPAASLLPAPGDNGSTQPNKLLVTGQQRAYLDALTAGGVHPSSELLALSIGSYVCQARAAGQSPQAVWDYVHPLVSSDVQNAHMSSMAPTSADIDAATQNYIRIASERLC